MSNSVPHFKPIINNIAPIVEEPNNELDQTKNNLGLNLPDTREESMINTSQNKMS